MSPTDGPWDFALLAGGNSLTFIGTITVNTSGAIAWPSFSNVALVPGNTVAIAAPGTQDSTGADVVFGLRYIVS